jgi:N-acetylmuramoyl-L-alanine amidase
VGLVVVVDPGHNGANGAHPAEIGRLVDAGGFQKPCNTTGTAGDGYPESRFNWETSQRLAAALEARGATVVLTRTSDDGWGPCVDERGLTAQRERAALIVSIHADGADPGASGFHVIHAAAGPAVSPQVAERSAQLATTVRDRLTEAGVAPADYLGGGTGLVARTDIATLNRAGVPGVMVECGNMRNPTDLARLRSPEGQQAVADAIVLAVVDRFAAR